MAWYQAKRNCRDCGEEQNVTIIGMAEYVDAAMPPGHRLCRLPQGDERVQRGVRDAAGRAATAARAAGGASDMKQVERIKLEAESDIELRQFYFDQSLDADVKVNLQPELVILFCRAAAALEAIHQLPNGAAIPLHILDEMTVVLAMLREEELPV